MLAGVERGVSIAEAIDRLLLLSGVGLGKKSSSRLPARIPRPAAHSNCASRMGHPHTIFLSAWVILSECG
jgi:hypothetical protein